MELLTRPDVRPSGWAVLFLAFVGGCNADTPAVPTKLIDGSPARPPAVALEGVDGPRVATLVRVTRADARSVPSAAACIAAAGQAAGTVVERIGVSGRSITFDGLGQRTLYACDSSAARRSAGDEWCGHAFDRVDSSRPHDPRLSLTCRAANGNPVGFAWIEPGADATFIAVQQTGYAEVYAVVGDVPVRVTTADTEMESSRAAFSISEHGGDGRRLRSYELEAQVAG